MTRAIFCHSFTGVFDFPQSSASKSCHNEEKYRGDIPLPAEHSTGSWRFFAGWFFGIGNTLACSMDALLFALTIRGNFLPEASIALLTQITTVVFTAVNFRGMMEAIIVITVMSLVILAVLVGMAALGFTDI